MIYKLVRVGLLFSLFLTVMLPVIANFSTDFLALSDISAAVTSFLNVTGSFFQNVHGLINSFLSRGLGQAGIIMFNFLIHASLLVPIFAYSARLFIFIRRELF